jgi:hypothetical protein
VAGSEAINMAGSVGGTEDITRASSKAGTKAGIDAGTEAGTNAGAEHGTNAGTTAREANSEAESKAGKPIWRILGPLKPQIWRRKLYEMYNEFGESCSNMLALTPMLKIFDLWANFESLNVGICSVTFKCPVHS